MRLSAASCLGLLLAVGASANEPIWTLDQRQAERDAVFSGRVESTARLYEAEPPVFAEGYAGDLREEVWVARVRVLDVRKGHPLLEAGPVVEVFFVRPVDPRVDRCPDYAALAAGETRLFFAQAAHDPVGGGEALFLEMGNDAGLGLPLSPGTGLRLATESWRVWWPARSGVPATGFPIAFTPSGRTWSRKLAGIDRWQLTADGSLELLAESGSASYRFRPRSGFLFADAFGEGLETEQVVWIGPAGTDFEALSSSPPVDLVAEVDRARPLPGLRGAPLFHTPVPEVVERFARHGIDLAPSYDEGGHFHEYRVTRPDTKGFKVAVRIWKYPGDWTEKEIQDDLLPYSLGRVVNGRYVLWWPSGEDVDDRETLWFESLQLTLVKRFEEMDL